jgi:hypothetical protein
VFLIAVSPSTGGAWHKVRGNKGDQISHHKRPWQHIVDLGFLVDDHLLNARGHTDSNNRESSGNISLCSENPNSLGAVHTISSNRYLMKSTSEQDRLGRLVG